MRIETHFARPRNEEMSTYDSHNGSPDNNNQEACPNAEARQIGRRALGLEVYERPVVRRDGLRRQPDLADSMAQLGRFAKASVVIGSEALKAAIGDAMPNEPKDVDISMEEGAFRELLKQPGWKEKRFPYGGDIGAVNGDFEVGIGWGGGMANHKVLHSYARTTPGGYRVSHMAPVYAYMQERDEPKDRARTQASRDRLWNTDPEKGPLPIEIIRHEANEVRELFERLGADLDEFTERMIADNLHALYVLGGHPTADLRRRIVGELELEEYGVRAFYHLDGEGDKEEMEQLWRHYEKIGVPIIGRKLGLIAHSGADRKYGGGRERDAIKRGDPLGRDEWVAGKIQEANALYLGASPEHARLLHTVVDGTTFWEPTKEHPAGQKGRHHPNPIVRGVAGQDLQILSENDSFEKAVRLVAEDGLSARPDERRPIGKPAIEMEIPLRTIEDVYRFVDDYPAIRASDAAPDDPTPKEYTVHRFRGNGNFHDPDHPFGHQYPDGWTGENRERRRATAQRSHEVADDLEAGRIKASDIPEIARAFTEEMNGRFPEAS